MKNVRIHLEEWFYLECNESGKWSYVNTSRNLKGTMREEEVIDILVNKLIEDSSSVKAIRISSEDNNE